MNQFVFQKGAKFYLVDVYPNGEVTLKIKEDGWNDIWSLPVKRVEI